MADRTSAGIFARIFTYLSAGDFKDPIDYERSRARQFAHDLWDVIGEYDFSPYQLGCDDALVKLGLARNRPDGMTYKGDDDFVAEG